MNMASYNREDSPLSTPRVASSFLPLVPGGVASDPSHTYADHSLPRGDVCRPCADLPGAWATLLEPIYGSEAVIHVRHITTGGSDRAFYRATHEERSHVVCVTPNRLEFQNYIAIGRFLRAQGLPIPEILSWSDTTGLAVLEDEGNTPLQDLVVRHGPEHAETLQAYRSVLRALGQMQRVPADACPAMGDRPFAYRDLRWETEYFRENFLRRHLGWDLSDDEALTADFEELAARVLAEPLFPMHRDFQSQNVFIKDDGLAILDFQGARVGPLPYDLASLIRDPYTSLPVTVEEHLLSYYHAHVMPPCERYASYETFRATYSVVSLQRLMQALGAYGFLTLVRGKPWFRAWMSPALANLSRAVDEVQGLGRLREVVHEAVCRNRIMCVPE